jgi:hypothetical protein
MRDGRQVTVTPKRNGGAATGFTEMPQQGETLKDPSPAAMSQAVWRSLARAAQDGSLPILGTSDTLNK